MIYLPGDPRTTMYVKKIALIEGLLERDTVMYVTSTHWREIVAELTTFTVAAAEAVDPTVVV